jgi:hypothetical protein
LRTRQRGGNASLGFEAFATSLPVGCIPRHSALAWLVRKPVTMNANSDLRLVTTSLAPVQATVATARRPGLLPDDRLYVRLLAAWVVVLAAVAYLLLG